MRVDKLPNACIVTDDELLLLSGLNLLILLLIVVSLLLVLPLICFPNSSNGDINFLASSLRCVVGATLSKSIKTAIGSGA